MLTNASAQPFFIARTENWGLGFQREGEPPTGNATVDELKRYDAYFLGDTSEKVFIVKKT